MSSTARPLAIGIDFDNTIACYDELMYRTAVAWGLIDAGHRRDKTAVRNSLRLLPDGESQWRRLQTHAYGEGMQEAVLMDGFLDFLVFCCERKIPVWIVSHKTKFNNFGPPTVNLRRAALNWMSKQGLFNTALTGLSQTRVYFEGTREEKISRIGSLPLSHFIDDLEDTFLAPSFPPQIGKIHYLPHATMTVVPGALRAGSWQLALEHFTKLTDGAVKDKA